METSDFTTIAPPKKDSAPKHRVLQVTHFVVVADSGLMNNENVLDLETNNYKYILGARIKNQNKAITAWFMSLEKKDGAFYEYQKNETTRLIVSYSEKRAAKDRPNREKGIKRLEKEFAKGNLTKDKINKRGYNKFLEISNDVNVQINYEKIKDDARWDGLKGSRLHLLCRLQGLQGTRTYSSSKRFENECR